MGLLRTPMPPVWAAAAKPHEQPMSDAAGLGRVSP